MCPKSLNTLTTKSANFSNEFIENLEENFVKILSPDQQFYLPWAVRQWEFICFMSIGWSTYLLVCNKQLTLVNMLPVVLSYL